MRYIDDSLATQLALLAAQGIHDPQFRPFLIPWSSVPSPQLERNALQHYWKARAGFSPTDWDIQFAVLVDGTVVGTTALIAKEFPIVRSFESGSWLGREHQGQGIGKEMRLATLHLGFAGLRALWATTSAWNDNGPSLGVTRSLGYAANGTSRGNRDGQPGQHSRFEMSRASWEERLRRDDIEILGLEECLALLELNATSTGR